MIASYLKRVFVDSESSERHGVIDKLMSHDTMCDSVASSVLECIVVNAKDDTTSCTKNVYNDVEFFARYTNGANGATSVFDTIHNCTLQGGKHVSKSIYSSPICGLEQLRLRQKYLKHIHTSMMPGGVGTGAVIQEALDTMSKNEKHISWLFEEKDENVQELYDMVFFRLKGLRALNTNGAALTTYNLYRILVSPIFGIIAPIVYFLVPYIVILYRFKVNLPFKQYMEVMYSSVFNSEDTMFGSGKHYKYIRIVSYLFSAVFYFQGVFNSIDVSRTVNKISTILVNNLYGVAQYLTSAHKLSMLLWDQAANAFIDTSRLETIEKENAFVIRLDACKPYSLMSLFGEQLKIYKSMYLPHNLALVKSIVAKSYVLDALIGAARSVNQHRASFVNLIDEATRPKVAFTDMAHPCLATGSQCVKNSIALGENGGNAIITSPNSSGKSIIIKAIVINILMAQTMGIICASEGHITPLAYITTQMNVPDSVGHESLFEAEMHRCKETLDALDALEKGDANSRSRLSLVVMDEIFNSTNPMEAVAGAYAVCKKMASYKFNTIIFTTHYGYLTKLAKEKECNFVNYRMQTLVNGDDIKFTYRIERGVNKHLLALELLKKSGFESSILDDAIAIKKLLKGT